MTGTRAGADPSTEQVAGFLGEVPLFASMDAALRLEVAETAVTVRVPAGDYLFRQGEPGDALYAVWSGRLEVLGGRHPIGVLGRGAAIGELALLTGDTRTASVRAVRDSELVAIDRERFQLLLRDDTEFAASLTRVLGHRLAGTVRPEPEVRERRSVLAVVALSPRVPVAVVTRHVLRTVGGWCRADELLPPDGQPGDPGALGRALDRAERDNDVVVLPSDPSADPTWTDFCLRQADRVLVVVDPRDPPGSVDERLRDRDLGIWSSQPPAAADLRPWIDELRPRARHWLPSGYPAPEGVARATRRILGRSVGVVLSGGGARGLAHVGAVAALLESGIEIDRYGGSSVGSFVSALFARGWSPEEVEEELRREVVARRPFADYTVPRHALIRAKRAARMFERVFGDLRVEELPLDWFGVTADLLTAETIVHRHGPMRYIVGASMCLPGLAPPLQWGRRLLVDGGVVNNLPVDIMDATGEGPVVGVEVMRRWKETWEQRLEATAAGAGDAGGTDRPPRFPLPSIVETISCATGLGTAGALDNSRELAWFTVAPELPDLGLLDWNRIDDAVAEGRRAALEALARAEEPAAPPPSPPILGPVRERQTIP